MYRYKYRPGYGSEELLIEFCGAYVSKELLDVLFAKLGDNGAKVENSNDLWMNDEVIFELTGAFGKFMVSSDTWGCVFVMASGNADGMDRIEQLLSSDPQFMSEAVDFEDYRVPEVKA